MQREGLKHKSIKLIACKMSCCLVECSEYIALATTGEQDSICANN